MPKRNFFSKLPRATQDAGGIIGSKKPAKDLGGPLRVIVTVFIIFIISQLLAVFIVAAGLAIIHPHGDFQNTLNNSAVAQFFYVLLAEVMAVSLVFSIVKRRGLTAAAIGLGRKPAWRDLKKALLGFAAFYVLLIIANVVLSVFFPSINTNQNQDVGFSHLNGTTDWLFALVGLVLLPPLGEEPLVRGYLYSALRSRWKFWPALLVTSVLFGIAHLQLGDGAPALWSAAVDTFVLSAVLVYLREATGALYAGILVHSLNNLIAFLVHFHR